jgi:hypothetical protein
MSETLIVGFAEGDQVRTEGLRVTYVETERSGVRLLGVSDEDCEDGIFGR